ncbi:MAG: hypothetical protein V1900_04720 [Candidatus Aenigmatarchaeota archaeon]
MDAIALYLAAAVFGFVIQTVIHGQLRMILDIAIGMVAGASISLSFFLPAVVCLGVALKIVAGRHLHCLILMAVYMTIGFLLGNYIF